MNDSTNCPRCGRINPTKHCQPCADRDQLDRESKESSKPVLNRYKDGSLAIQSCPEIFLCARSSIEMLVNNHNQAIAASNDARAEIERLATQLAEARDQAHNADLRTSRAKKERDAISNASDKMRTLAGELIAVIRVNHMRGTFAEATPEQVDEWLQPFIQRLNAPPSHEDATGRAAATQDDP